MFLLSFNLFTAKSLRFRGVGPFWHPAWKP